MRVFTSEECAAWSERLVAVDERRKPTRDLGKPHGLRCEFRKAFTQMLWFSRCVEAALQPRHSCLVWVTDWGIFPSNENLHLFYRLRQTYGDTRLLHEAPGHLCLDFESAEVVTLVHLGMLFGWDLHLIPTAGYARAFVSHHQWVEIGFDHDTELQASMKDLQAGGVVVSANPPGAAG
ncbi:MAG TPA: hypothetical protein VF912_00320 [Anaeromyxobacter sp.]|nr:hypothetical protein [Gemmatimonadales bacterium]